MKQTEFLNVDLDLFGAELAEVLAALEPGAFAINEKREATEMATLELAGSPRTLEDAVVGFADLVDRLPPHAREGWDRCDRRLMNVGIQAGNSPNQAMFHLSEHALARLASMHAELVFTVYASEQDPSLEQG